MTAHPKQLFSKEAFKALTARHNRERRKLHARQRLELALFVSGRASPRTVAKQTGLTARQVSRLRSLWRHHDPIADSTLEGTV